MGRAEGSSTNRVQISGDPGRHSQPAASSVSNVGGSRLRRRLSKTFQISMLDKRLRATPVWVRTKGNNQGNNCQSPRIQRLQAPGIHQVARRIFLIQDDIRDQRSPPMQPFE